MRKGIIALIVAGISAACSGTVQPTITPLPPTPEAAPVATNTWDKTVLVVNDYTILARTMQTSYRHTSVTNSYLIKQDQSGDHILVDGLFSETALSPDQQWLAFAVLRKPVTFQLDLFKMRVDGTDLQPLTTADTQFVGMRRLEWSPDGNWITANTWNGSDPGDQETSWKNYRIKTDGSGIVEPTK